MLKSNKKLVLFLAIILCVSFVLTGCKDKEKEAAIEQAATSKIELAEVKANLATLQSKLTTVIEARDKLQLVAEQAAKAKQQLAEITKQKDAAMAKVAEVQSVVTKLKSQLADQIKKFTGLQEQNQKLQDLISKLKGQLGSEVELPIVPSL